MTDNKRAHKRVPIAGSAKLAFHDRGKDVSLEAMVSNVSLSGIVIYAERQIKDGTEVLIKINFTSSDGLMKIIIMKGHIVYARQERIQAQSRGMQIPCDGLITLYETTIYNKVKDISRFDLKSTKVAQKDQIESKPLLSRSTD